MEEKRFCTKQVYNEILFETKNFKVIPSLGSLVEGWLLVIPKIHYISYGEITDVTLLEELDMLLNYVCNIIKIEYGEYIIFEHGPIEENSKVGCGVDYAHIHIVPIKLNLDLINSLSQETLQWANVESLHSTSSYTNSGRAYLYFQDNSKNCYIGTKEDIPSQFFRRIIATIIGRPQIFDWKTNYFLENVKSTYARLKKYKKLCAMPKRNEYA